MTWTASLETRFGQLQDQDNQGSARKHWAALFSISLSQTVTKAVQHLALQPACASAVLVRKNREI